MKKNFQHLKNSTIYTIQGIRNTYSTEMSFRQEVFVLAIIPIISYIFSYKGTELLILMTTWLFVMTIELINSAIESVVDRISVEKHHLSGKAKDQASAAVFMAIMIHILSWIWVLL